MILNENFIEFISLLNKFDVKYLIVGGWAVIFEGYSRTTGDMDILIECSETNAEKILEVLKDFWGSAIGFYKADFTTEDNVIMMGRMPFRIDILTSISGVTFNEAFQSCKIYNDGSVEIKCIGIEQLIKNKRATGRLQDLADAEMLEKILKKRNSS